MKYQKYQPFEAEYLKQINAARFEKVVSIFASDIQDVKFISDHILERLTQKNSSYEVVKTLGKEHSSEQLASLLSEQGFNFSAAIHVIELPTKPTKKWIQGWMSYLDDQMSNFLVVFIGTSSKGYEELPGLCLDLTKEKPWDKKDRRLFLLNRWLSSQSKQISYKLLDRIYEDQNGCIFTIKNELEKLICFDSDQPQIQEADYQKLCAQSNGEVSWSDAESIVLDIGVKKLPSFITQGLNAEKAVALITQLRYFFQTGYKFNSLSLKSKEELKKYFPQFSPQKLTRMLSLSRQFKSSYFKRGLKLLFAVEMDLKQRPSLCESYLMRFLAEVSELKKKCKI